MKKITSLFIVLTLILTLASCQSNSEPQIEPSITQKTTESKEMTYVKLNEKDCKVQEREGEYIFYEYTGNEKNIIIPSVIDGKNISIVEAFRDNLNIENVKVEEGINYIGVACFEGCSNLKSIELPESLKQIWLDGFFNCTSLTSVTIPKNVTDLDQRAFCNCSSLKEVIFEGNNLRQLKIGCFNGTAIKELVIPERTTYIDQILEMEGVTIHVPSTAELPNLIEFAPDGPKTIIVGKANSPAQEYAKIHNNTFVQE